MCAPLLLNFSRKAGVQAGHPRDSQAAAVTQGRAGGTGGAFVGETNKSTCAFEKSGAAF